MPIAPEEEILDASTLNFDRDGAFKAAPSLGTTVTSQAQPLTPEQVARIQENKKRAESRRRASLARKKGRPQSAMRRLAVAPFDSSGQAATLATPEHRKRPGSSEQQATVIKRQRSSECGGISAQTSVDAAEKSVEDSPVASSEPKLDTKAPIISEARQRSMAEILRIEHHPKLASLGQRCRNWSLVQRINEAHKMGQIDDSERDRFHTTRREGNRAKHAALGDFDNTQTW
jgi:hypothetical protein